MSKILCLIGDSMAFALQHVVANIRYSLGLMSHFEESCDVGWLVVLIIFLFPYTLGIIIIPIDFHIFSEGWLNHQPVGHWRTNSDMRFINPLKLFAIVKSEHVSTNYAIPITGRTSFKGLGRIHDVCIGHQPVESYFQWVDKKLKIYRKP